MILTTHALDRYRERIRADATRADVLACLRSAKPKHLKRLSAGRRNTLIVPAGCCFFICSGQKVVSVVKEMREAASPINPKVAE